jgi:hypothetical protein
MLRLSLRRLGPALLVACSRMPSFPLTKKENNRSESFRWLSVPLKSSFLHAELANSTVYRPAPTSVLLKSITSMLACFPGEIDTPSSSLPILKSFACTQMRRLRVHLHASHQLPPSNDRSRILRAQTEGMMRSTPPPYVPTQRHPFQAIFFAFLHHEIKLSVYI